MHAESMNDVNKKERITQYRNKACETTNKQT